jgi:tetratricopeptide (TPR) repeat protein
MNIFVFLPPKLIINRLNIFQIMKIKKILLLVVFFGLGMTAMAQTINEAGEAFNQGIQFTKDNNFAEALKAYQQTISICDQLGDEGVDLKMKAEQQMPTTYYNLAKSFYEAKQYTDAIANFELSATWADQMGEEKTADASRTYLAGIYTGIGLSDYKKEEYDAASGNFNKALEYKADYYKAYYGLGLVYKKQEKMPEMKAAMDKVLELAPEGEKTADNARSAAATAFLNEGAVALQKGSLDNAIANLATSLEYDPNDPKTHYYMALAYKDKKDFDNAISSATKSIDLGVESKGDAWFLIGQANEGKGDTAAACEAYLKVTDGLNVEAAKYQVTQVLKCN